MPIQIIAEAGVNHNGDFGLALKMADAAKAAGERPGGGTQAGRSLAGRRAGSLPAGGAGFPLCGQGQLSKGDDGRGGKSAEHAEKADAAA